MLIQLAILGIFNFLNALYDSIRIKSHKRIYHSLNGAAYLVLIGILVWWVKPSLLDGVLFVIHALCNRQSIFDTSLNLLRGLPIDYTSINPTSVIDKLEIRVFGRNGLYPFATYALIFTGTLIYYVL
jgi:hypothetical protein